MNSPSRLHLAARRALALCLVALAAGCGGGDEASGGAATAQGTPENYRDADWLQQRYTYLASQPRSTAEKVANGVTVRIASGESKDEVIRDTHRALAELPVAAPGGAKAAAASPDPVPLPGPSVVTINGRQVTAEQAREISDAHFEATMEREYGVRKEDLPYAVEGQDKWIGLYGEESSKAKLSRGKTAQPAAAASKSSAAAAPNYFHNSLPTAWTPGDVIWAIGSSAPGIINHVGITVEERSPIDGLPKIIDAIPADGVNIRNSMREWTAAYSQVAQLVPQLPNITYPVLRSTGYIETLNTAKDIRFFAMNFAWQAIGKPYWYNYLAPIAKVTNQFYCSSLIWHAYKQTYGYFVGSYFTGGFWRDGTYNITFRDGSTPVAPQDILQGNIAQANYSYAQNAPKSEAAMHYYVTPILMGFLNFFD